MLIILWNSLHWSGPHSTDSKQSRQHWALANNAGNEHLPKATSTKELPNARIEEDIEQHDQDSPPLEGRFKYHLEMEPDMLRQLDQRLISNEQLVVELKGIYAGLVVVEAKCIEIDEKQLASAKEKDLCKRVSLQNHQWQSLIALHRQVHTLPRARRSTTYRAAFTNYLSTSYFLNTMTSSWRLNIPLQAQRYVVWPLSIQCPLDYGVTEFTPFWKS